MEGKRRLFLNRKVHEKDFARYRAPRAGARDSLIATNSGSITRRDARLRFDIASDSVKTFASPKYEVIEDGREGAPVSGSDPIALADAIEGLLRDLDRRARMVRAAADKACRC